MCIKGLGVPTSLCRYVLSRSVCLHDAQYFAGFNTRQMNVIVQKNPFLGGAIHMFIQGLPQECHREDLLTPAPKETSSTRKIGCQNWASIFG